jgi:hypothetical protein
MTQLGTLGTGVMAKMWARNPENSSAEETQPVP